MSIELHKDLRPFNTFGLSAYTARYLQVADEAALQEWWQTQGTPPEGLLVLGGGSNVLLTRDFPGLTLHMAIRGQEVIAEDDRTVLWQLGAGECWHDSVLSAVDSGWGGIENLALIPGTVGAAPMQNIGAYGVELKDVFHSLQAFHLPTGHIHTFDKEACRFGYRTSVFKHEVKGQYIITRVTLRLHKAPHVLHTGYGAVAEELALRVPAGQSPGITDVAQAVMAIRRSKLPDPAELGNAGSFFKNPLVPAAQHSKLRTHYPEIPGWPQPDGQVKVPAAWLIEQTGWKGKRLGHAGAHARQPLVLVNYGGATGQEMLALAQAIRQSVRHTFDIDLEPEVNVV
ncbi:MAG: UDP-N-acetylmuramate dehydrogenase [Bacteroidetes bacterium]|nr:UDP-N-acetylmuramate dehydrogenase [Bacteroidota bacterium]